MKKYELLERIENWKGGVFWVFLIKQAWSALFGGLLLLAIIFTSYVELPWLSRYDWLFVFAIAIQAGMLLIKLEKPYEIVAIASFHLVGLGMELFKTSNSINSWSYPGDSFFHVGNVPLFSGFMYAAVGSYMARAWRAFDLQFAKYPNRLAVGFIGVAIYVNFFTHHFFYDIRYLLFAALLVLFWRTKVSYRPYKKIKRMPLLIGFGLIASAIWLAENISTFAYVWLYPNQQNGWHLVSLGKLGSWFLLTVISFIMIDTLYVARRKLKKSP